MSAVNIVSFYRTFHRATKLGQGKPLEFHFFFNYVLAFPLLINADLTQYLCFQHRTFHRELPLTWSTELDQGKHLEINHFLKLISNFY